MQKGSPNLGMWASNSISYSYCESIFLPFAGRMCGPSPLPTASLTELEPT